MKKFIILLSILLSISILLLSINIYARKKNKPTQTEITNDIPKTEQTITNKKETNENFLEPPISTVKNKEKLKVIDEKLKTVIEKTESTQQTGTETVNNTETNDAPEDYSNKKKKIIRYDIKKFATEPELISALKLIEENKDDSVIKNIQKYSIRVKFDDFSHIMYKRNAYFGMSAYNQYGIRFIMINSYYKTAPTEQLACIISHESMHISKSPTMEEENIATRKEAECWKNLRSLTQEYPNTKLTQRLNKLINLNNSDIEQHLAKTEIYKEQFAKELK